MALIRYDLTVCNEATTTFDSPSKFPLLSRLFTENLPFPEYSFDDVFPPWDPPDSSSLEQECVIRPKNEINFSKSTITLMPQSQKEIDLTFWRPSVDQQIEQGGSSPPSVCRRSIRRSTRPAPKASKPSFSTSESLMTQGKQEMRTCSSKRLDKRTLEFDCKGGLKKTWGYCQSDAYKATCDW